MLLLVVGLGGCQIQSLSSSQTEVNETVVTGEVSDLSSEMDVEVAGRGWGEQVAYYQNGGLVHSTLYLEDLYEGQGSHDGVFATWGRDDAEAAVVGPFRFLVNVLLLPVELLKRHPWLKQESRSIMAVEGPVYEFGGLPSGKIRDSGDPGN